MREIAIAGLLYDEGIICKEEVKLTLPCGVIKIEINAILGEIQRDLSTLRVLQLVHLAVKIE